MSSTEKSDREASEEAEAPRNQMGYWACTSYVIGNVIGSGIVITPTAILNNTQSIGLDLLVWVGCGLISILGAICYIELGTSILEPGCDFAYTCYVGWQGVAFSFMWVGVLMTFPASSAVQALTMGEYIVRGISPLVTFEEPWDVYIGKGIGLLLMISMTALNFFSIDRFAARVQIVSAAAKVLLLGVIICTGMYCLIFLGQTENLQDMFAGSVYEPGKLALAFYGGLWSFGGWDILNYGTPEVYKPRRTMPLAIISAMLVVISVYLLINVSYFVVLTKEQITNSTAVAADFSQEAFGDFSYVIPFMVAILLIGSLNSNIFAGSRYMHAAARGGQLPPFLSAISVSCNSPRAALLGQLISMIFVSLVDVNTMISYVIFVIFAQRGFSIIALLYLKARKMEVAPGAIRVPVVLTVLFLIISIALLCVPFIEEPLVTSIGVVCVFSGLIIYFLLVRPTRSPRCLKSISDFLSRVTCKVLRSKLDLAASTEDKDGEETSESTKNTSESCASQDS